MSSEWIETTIGELVTLQRGHDLPTQDRARGHVPIMGSAGITGYHDRHTTKGPGVVIGRSGVGSMGVVSYIDRDYWALNTTLFVKDFHGNDERFIYYLLKTINFRQFDTGSAQASLNRNVVYPYRVRVPNSLQGQRRIASMLTALEDRMILLRETNATLEAIAQALFKSWFVDFDPVRAKMAGRAPDGMDEATATLFPNALEETELGVVPKGWAFRPFINAVDVIGGGTPKTSNPDYWGGEIPWFSVVDAPDGADTFVVDTDKHITEAGLNGSATKLLMQGTTIISARGTVGKLALAGCPMAMNQSCYGLQGKSGDSYFTYFSTYRLVEALKAHSHGSVFDTITRDTLASVHSLLPPNGNVINAFEKAVKPLMNRILVNLHQSRGLGDLRDTLLPRLISGHLRLPEAQSHLEDALA